MTTVIAGLLLCSVVLAWTLFPLWQRASDRDLGDGLEKDDRVAKWREEKDRLVAEMVALDIALAEKKIDRPSYDMERGRVMAEAETAAEELRKARADAPERAHVARTYPMIGGALAALVAISTITLAVVLDRNDLRSDVNPHASGRIPLSPEQSAAGPPNGVPPRPDMPNPHASLGAGMPMIGAEGAPDIGAMVGRLEEKVKAGGASLDDVMMLARSYRVLGREDDSLAMYRKARELEPDQPQLDLVLASALLRSDSDADHAEAEQIVEKALAAEPARPEALWLKSIGLIRRHDFEPAKEILGRLQSIVGDNTEARAAVAGLLAELDGVRPPADAPSAERETAPYAAKAPPSAPPERQK